MDRIDFVPDPCCALSANYRLQNRVSENTVLHDGKLIEFTAEQLQQTFPDGTPVIQPVRTSNLLRSRIYVQDI